MTQSGDERLLLALWRHAENQAEAEQRLALINASIAGMPGVEVKIPQCYPHHCNTVRMVVWVEVLGKTARSELFHEALADLLDEEAVMSYLLFASPAECGARYQREVNPVDVLSLNPGLRAALDGMPLRTGGHLVTVDHLVNMVQNDLRAIRSALGYNPEWLHELARTLDDIGYRFRYNRHALTAPFVGVQLS